MDTYKCNYHMHSYYSDGTMSPAQLVRKFADEEYDIIALTDHDGIDGLKEFTAACEAVKIRGVTGIEFSTEHVIGDKKYGIHILGYGFDPENELLADTCTRLKEIRHERNVRLTAALKDKGYELDLDELESMSKGKYVGKPNIARMMCLKGYAAGFHDAFGPDKLESPEIKAIRKQKLSSGEAIDIIRQAGGQAFIAHPLKIKGIEKTDAEAFWNELTVLVCDLKKRGLKGMECIYPTHSEEDEFRLIQIAGKYHLHISAGTDYHGEDAK